MSVIIEGFWAEKKLQGTKLTYEQYQLVTQTIVRWTQLLHQSGEDAGHVSGYFRSVPTENRAAVREQMADDIEHSSLLFRMLTGGSVSREDPREKVPL